MRTEGQQGAAKDEEDEGGRVRVNRRIRRAPGRRRRTGRMGTAAARVSVDSATAAVTSETCPGK